MSRKRFIKLCMAKGLPRNQATEEAEYALTPYARTVARIALFPGRKQA